MDFACSAREHLHLIGGFNLDDFLQRVGVTAERLQTLLDNTRKPQLPSDVPHTYHDKYRLAEFIGQSGLAGVVNCLQALHADPEKLQTMRQWADSRTVTLQFKLTEKCKLKKKRMVEDPSPIHQTDHTNYVGKAVNAVSVTIQTMMVSKHPEWDWTVSIDYELSAYCGNDTEKPVVLQNGKSKTVMTTMSENPPRGDSTSTKQVEITYLFKHLSAELQPTFVINRDSPSCRTPRRNQDVDRLFSFLNQIRGWTDQMRGQYDTFLRINPSAGELSSLFSQDSVFVPVVPLFETLVKNDSNEKLPENIQSLIEACTDEEKEEESLAELIPLDRINDYLHEHQRSLEEKLADIEKTFNDSGDPLRFPGVTFSCMNLVIRSLQDILEHTLGGINFIEAMLFHQLQSAVGKSLSANDFYTYMEFHYRKMFKPEYKPVPFVHAIRRPDHSPEGVISIESKFGVNSELSQPITAFSRRIECPHPMHFVLDAATKAEFTGDHYVHSFVLQQFEGGAIPELVLKARARQFSSFLLVLGRIVSETEIEPEHAIIIRNKDELEIPLMLERLPTAKAFKDAISSLSEEQQRFAKAYRSMQLSSTLFTLVAIQIKPQLEKLLNLTYDSLTKEIRLTEDLIDLFTKYHIPSQLLSYDPEIDLYEPSLPVPSLFPTDSLSAYIDDDNFLSASGIMKEFEDDDPFSVNSSNYVPLAVEQDCRHRIASVKKHVVEMEKVVQEQKDLTLEEAREEYNYAKPPLPIQTSDSDSEEEVDHYVPVRRRPVKHVRKKGLIGRLRSVFEGGAQQSKRYECDDMWDANVCLGDAGGGGGGGAPPGMGLRSGGRLAPLGGLKPGLAQSASKSGVKQKQVAEVKQAEAGSVLRASLRESVGFNSNKLDYTKLPRVMDRNIESKDCDACLSSLVIRTGANWNKTYLASLLSKPSTSCLAPEMQTEEKAKAFLLLDVLTRSGDLSFDDATLHVILGFQHSFDRSIIETVVQGNINPIERVERSSLIISSTLQSCPPADLVTASSSPLCLSDLS